MASGTLRGPPATLFCPPEPGPSRGSRWPRKEVAVPAGGAAPGTVLAGRV